MEIVLVFLLSVGFVGGLFSGLRKSLRSLFVFLFSFLFLFLMIPFLAELAGKMTILKGEFVQFVGEKALSKIDLLNISFSTTDDLVAFCDGIESNFFKKILLGFSSFYTPPKMLYIAISEWLYTNMVFILFGIVAFIGISLTLRVVFNFFFKLKIDKCGLFVTRRLFGGFFGFTKGFILFVAVLNILNITAGLFGFVDFLGNESLILSESFNKNVSAILHGYA